MQTVLNAFVVTRHAKISITRIYF